MRFLLDTCVLSEWFYPKPADSVLTWLDATDINRQCVSVVTLGEIAQGIVRLGLSKRSDRLAHWLHDEIVPRFEGRIMGIDRDVAFRWGELRGGAIARGRTPPAIDSLLAATALVHGMTVVTRNVADFEPFNVRIFNPWVAP